MSSSDEANDSKFKSKGKGSIAKVDNNYEEVHKKDE